MTHWTDIRAHARRLHRELSRTAQTTLDTTPSAGLSAEGLLESAADFTGIPRIPVAANDPLLYGSLATLANDCVWYNADVESWFGLYCQAHEYAHHWLHHGRTHCTRDDIEGSASEDTSPIGESRIIGYGPHELREREANVFAREFLLPSDALRHWFIEEGLNATSIAERTGLPVDLVCQQLMRALLVSDLEERFAAKPEETRTNPVPANLPVQHSPAPYLLDHSQSRAARAPSGPLLIEAGPGTGKTRTLIGRVLYLLERGVDPQNILALTFSNKAAEEMQERVAEYASEAQSSIWIGTFHAFGLELLRKYWQDAGLPPKPALLDPVDALFVLERSLPQLHLDYYQNLSEPTLYLKNILSAISRAKDELVDPARYMQLANDMHARATSDEEIEKAGKAVEVARLYAFYQDYLEREQLLDFGDLIFRSVHLLRDRNSVRKDVLSRFKEILVDEYQDVNRASGLLLRELAGEGLGLWAVGDVRQSIYRWRGASTANIRLFERDFPGATVHSLEVNYRSQPPILSVFSELAPTMKAARVPGATMPWTANRPHAGGEVKFEITEHKDAEALYLAYEIQTQQARGIPLRDQAVICRSHNILAHFAKALEDSGVPVLYLGDIFEREEVRDLLSLLELSCEESGTALLRVAAFPQYRIPVKDVRRLLYTAQEGNQTFPAALASPDLLAGISKEGAAKLALLHNHLQGICDDTSAWKMLSEYLFVKSNYLRPLLADTSVSGSQKRLALYQFLQFTQTQSTSEWYEQLGPRLALLKYVRRLELFGEEKNYRQVPEWAEGIDAVRMLTIHASKGLEFRAVYLPYLGGRYMPHQRMHEPCPPPVGLIEGITDPEAEHHEEEECLFFVALSRARDLLSLSRSQTYGKQKSNASRFLETIQSRLPRAANADISWRPANTAQTSNDLKSLDQQLAAATTNPPSPRFSLRQLDVYLRCPKRYFYEKVLYLRDTSDDSVYKQFHTCVYSTIGWMQQQWAAGRILDGPASNEKLRELWMEKGPVGHAYEATYMDQAAAMIARAVTLFEPGDASASQPEWELTLSNGRVIVRPDMVLSRRDARGLQLVIEKVKTGRPTESELKKEIYGMYHAASEQHFPEAEKVLRVVYLSTGDTVDVPLTPKRLKGILTKYEDAIAGIQRKDFPAIPSSRNCPTCAYYFICPSGADAH